MNICVCGIGRAGQAMLQRLIKSEHRITGALVQAGSECIGKDIGEYMGAPYIGTDILCIDDCTDILREKKTDLIIDFSSNSATEKLLSIASDIECRLVICTTNHSDEMIDRMKKVADANSIGVVYAPNLTLGINLLIDYVAQLSKMLPGFDFEIVERHSIVKPRVTMTAKIISKAIGRGDTHISSVRAGGYVGVHEVTCANENERITIVHESFSRQAFADGAMLAADFISCKTGFYRMSDVIDEIKKKALS